VTDIWFIADLHLSHEKMILGWAGDGKGPRSDFASTIEEHDEKLIERINAVVKPQDKLYILGDVALSKAGLDKVRLINGHKRLVLGNHDQDTPKRYAGYFDKVCGAKVLEPGLVLTHIPIHPACLNRKSMQVNVHGHMHDEQIPLARSTPPMWGSESLPDPRYIGVSCEQVDYTPVHFDYIVDLALGVSQ
jgi:calcineurin-like phosphoesterase family protein